LYVLPAITDPENDPCTITIVNMPSWTTFDDNLKKFTFNPPTGSANDYTISFNLNDPTHSVPKYFYLKVTYVAIPPPPTNQSPYF